ncbi:MAG: hypothetical protein VW867_10045 [Gammaproteobacteria bacterium]
MASNDGAPDELPGRDGAQMMVPRPITVWGNGPKSLAYQWGIPIVPIAFHAFFKRIYTGLL